MYRQLLVLVFLFAVSAKTLDAKSTHRHREHRQQHPSSSCRPGEFLCNSSRGCIPNSWVCDGDNDCRDMSDEPATCMDKAPLPCPALSHSDLDDYNFRPMNHFNCSTTRRCLEDFYQCDGKDDCGDNSDEPESCKEKLCPEGSVQCPSGKCITTDFYCSGYERCFDGWSLVAPSSPVKCPQLRCDFDETICKHGKKCIPLSNVCDGDDNCGDNSDEESCRNRECTEEEIRCNNGRCLKKDKFCARRHFSWPDKCGDGTDFSELCDNFICPDGMMKCDDGLCVNNYSRCNGHVNCRDGSDELNCPAEFYCSDVYDYEKCPGFHQCIERLRFCDGRNDCHDGSDEDPRLCGNRTCSGYAIRCSNGQCFHQNEFCRSAFLVKCFDGSRSNDDGSTCQMSECDIDGYEICPGRSYCIPRRFFCDSDDDCGDQSDEEAEMCASRTCEDAELRCDNGQCLDINRFCSGIDICRDGSQTKDGHICDEFRHRQSTRPEVNYSEWSYLATQHDKCSTTLEYKCGLPWVVAQLHWRGTAASMEMLKKLEAMEMQQICGSIQAWLDCVVSELNKDLQCAELTKWYPDIPRLLLLAQAAYNFTCVKNLNVIGREKACLLKQEEYGESVLHIAMNQCLMDRYKFGLHFGDDNPFILLFCQAVVQFTEDSQQCVTTYVRQQCGDDMGTVISMAGELAEFAREDVCQQSVEWQLVMSWYWGRKSLI